MAETIQRLLAEQPVLLLFSVLGFGYLIGRARFRSFQLGPGKSGQLHVASHFLGRITSQGKTTSSVLALEINATEHATQRDDGHSFAHRQESLRRGR